MDGKQLAKHIFLRTLQELDVAGSISRCVSFAERRLRCGDREYPLSSETDLRVIAIGKAAHQMLDGLCALLPPETVITGVVASPVAPDQHRFTFQYFLGGHPVPNAQSLLAGEAILKLLRNCKPTTLVIVLLSGGGSALAETPLLRDCSLNDLQQMNRALVTCGASIAEINTIRKHLSAIKGGRIATLAAPANVLTLAISDVPIGQESALASGPTLPDPTTRSDAIRILKQFDLGGQFPAHLVRWMQSSEMPESPKPQDISPERNQFQIVLGMRELFHSAHRIAEAQDCIAFCDNSTDEWPIEKAADYLLAQLNELRAANPGRRVTLIADGELSSAVTGNGIGGRNSAFVLACVEKIAGKGIAVLSAGTDGIDGNSPAAGAVADGETLSRGAALRLDPRDYFDRSDSFNFFNSLGDAIVTGPTGNNLRDLRLLIACPQL